MKKKLLHIASHPLISGSSVVFAGTLVGNICSFLFNLFMSRNLSIENYGILASLISLITIVSIPAAAFIPTIVRFSGSHFAKNELSALRSLYNHFFSIAFVCGFFITIIFSFFSKNIGTFFHIHNNTYILLGGIVIFLGYISIINIGFIQAKLSFRFLSFSTLTGSLLKLIFGVFFVLLGYAVTGALWAFILAAIIPYMITFYPLRLIFSGKIGRSSINVKTIINYGGPAAATTLGLMSLVTTDLILVKHFFDPKSAGIYAGISLIGRVIFFFSAPIGTVMFPLVVQRHAKNEKHNNLFVLAFILTLIPSLLLVLMYYLFPEFVILFFLKKREYLSAASLVGYFGLFICCYSLVSVLTNYFLSIKKTKVVFPVIISAILQCVLISFFHTSFFQIISVSFTISALLLLLLLLYYWILYGQDRKT